MIYTVTLNPAIDYVIKVDNFETGIVNRTKQENMFFGGILLKLPDYQEST